MKIEITILGLLMDENLYGYDIKKKIIQRMDDFVDIKFGSIYYAIKKAVANGWVKKSGTEKDAGNPERYVYQILPEGRKYYKKALKKYLEKHMLHFDVDIVLMFLNSLTPEQKASFIEERSEYIKDKLNDLKDKPVDDNNRHILSYIDNHLRAEQKWLKSLSE
jgi:DNA-binding PadR family transcriptional regulator